MIKDKNYKIIVYSFIAGLLVWVIDSVFDSIIFYEGSFWELLITDIPKHEVYIRTLAWASFVIWGIITAIIFTKRKQAEDELRKVNRAYKTLSECNQVLVRAEDELDLLNEICRIIVDTGRYHLAWVGYAEQDEEKNVRPVGGAGYKDSYLDTIKVTWSDSELGRGPTGTAIRTGAPSIARNISAQLDYEPWRTEATKRGFASSIALPLTSGEQTFGALNIYSLQPNAFDEVEVNLLTELADDLAYGILAIRTRAEHKRSEEKLLESEKRYKTIFGNTGTATTIIEENSTISLANDEFERLSGYSRAEVEGRKSWKDFVEGEYLEKMSEYHKSRRIDPESAPKSYEFRFTDKNGNLKDIIVNVAMIPGTKKSVASLLDITERNRAEAKVFRQNAMLNAINKVFLESITSETEEELASTCLAVVEELTGSRFGFIGELNSAGRFDTIVISNPGWGICKIPKSKATVFINDMEVRGIWGKALKDGISLLTNDPESHPDSVGVPPGHPSLTSFLGVPLQQAGKTIGMIALGNKESGYNSFDLEAVETVSIAILEALKHKRAALAVQEARKYAENIVDTMHEPLMVLDTGLRVVSANRFFYQSFKVTPEETEGRLIYELGNHQLDIPGLRELLEEILPRNTFFEDFKVELDFPTVGQRIILLNARRIYREVNKTRLILLAFEDITERTKAEEQLKKHEEHLVELVQERTKELGEKTAELEQTNLRLQEADRHKSIFLATMSHELRTPLNSIIGFTGVILQEMAGKINKEQRKQLTIVKNSANHLLRLINDILDVSKIESGKVELFLEEFDVNDVVKEVVENFSQLAHKKDLEFFTDVPEGITLFSDKRRLKQILMNFVSNAFKFTSRGSIKLAAKMLNDNNFEIRVIDTGIGIKKENLNKLFMPFQQIDMSSTKNFEGTGLGLYLTKKLAVLLQGDVSVKSEYGRGSEFILTILLNLKEDRQNANGVGD